MQAVVQREGKDARKAKKAIRTDYRIGSTAKAMKSLKMGYGRLTHVN